MRQAYDCLALFSGGLDSMLSCKLMQQQGLRVLGLHFISPFFGRPDRIEHWQSEHDIDILPVDVRREFLQLLLQGPKWGLGKCLNPCVDCKIHMLRRAREMLAMFGARFIVSGEVLGQRPMSQRKDTLGLIRKEAGVQDVLLRPLSAASLPETPMEATGLVDREKLPNITGRGRKPQLELARELGMREIPTPAGGCLLTDPGSCARFWPLISRIDHPEPEDFLLAQMGRQYWNQSHWLTIGRNKQDNQALLQQVQTRDIVFKPEDIPGPLAVGRQHGQPWSEEMIRSAAELLLSFSPKARKVRGPVRIRAGSGDFLLDLSLDPGSEADPGWKAPEWEELEREKRTFFRREPPKG
jgi:hypothetical protein